MNTGLANQAQSRHWLECFRQIGAIWEAAPLGGPHVRTSLKGAHVDKYFNSDIVVASPKLTMAVVESVLVPEVAKKGLAPDWILTYAPFGLFVAHAVAQALDAQCAYCDPSGEYVTNFEIGASDSVLVIADDIHSGASVLRTIAQIERRETQVAPTIFCLANMSGKQRLGGRQILAAVDLKAHSYAAESCPLCAEGSPAVAPRGNWRELVASMPTS